MREAQSQSVLRGKRHERMRVAFNLLPHQ
jgi:hypothetical protein